ncbi:hypothetical protein XaplCFBP3122_10265 [Xanthomonas arboricola pv. populi]|uniref:Uncharacterized protein n=1 Tax=Xanthomonas arboricola pv. populi TaxID=487823 RepID=A0A2S6Z575_9XANT|nr:hypothetical protein XaplCFBP3122_10265 [Xanthomonas arboricola pv. populi]
MATFRHRHERAAARPARPLPGIGVPHVRAAAVARHARPPAAWALQDVGDVSHAHCGMIKAQS